ncbi:Nif3-like dinuclear metal center hexameric protein [Methanopyrus sp. SNP6]|uniref:Nif3-like dinuclear metal center hexameric protein n=1 Tax=Methanopyrus sp. SNP6 TaxID=1937005 RepID=UPI00143A6FE7|nr:Nif3-like dinuclear metal center hexameric protein [Methanopyrus sp. SNP6]
MATVQEVIDFVEELAPPDLAEDWDNPGIQVCPPGGLDSEAERVMVALDATHALERAGDADLVLTHHPLLFRLPRRISGRWYRVLRAVLETDAVFYAAHTNLDRAEGGVADTLARRLNLRVECEACDGFGRLCRVPGSEEELLNALRNLSPLTTVHGEWEGVGRVLVVPGAAPDGLVTECLRCGVDAVITGEIKYHARAELLKEGITVVELGHEYSELPGVQELARRVREEFRGLNVEVAPPPDLTIIR